MSAEKAAHILARLREAGCTFFFDGPHMVIRGKVPMHLFADYIKSSPEIADILRAEGLADVPPDDLP